MNKKYILMYFFIFHLFTVFVVCIFSSATSYISFYKFNDTTYKPPLIYSWFNNKLLRNPIINNYLITTGIESGYGFFAPNVASGYIIEYELLDKNNNLVKTLIYPDTFSSTESYNRYCTFLGIFQDKMLDVTKSKEKKEASQKKDIFIPQKYNNLNIKYLDILVKVAGRYVLKKNRNNGINQVITTLYLYDYPSYKFMHIKDKNSSYLVKLYSVVVNK